MKKSFINPILITILLSLILTVEGNSCTTFCLKDARNLLLAKNFDFFTGIGHVVTNKRNVRKMSVNPPSEKQMEWVSKYGSVSFNQTGREFPYGGMNERGLVIEQMWLTETRYPDLDNRFGLFDLQWIQYQLDNSATVEEVIASDGVVRISNAGSAPLHFMVVDAQGNMATIEFLNGKMTYHTGSALPACVLTNDTFEQCSKFVSALPDLKTRYTNDPSSGSFDRFAKATLMVREFAGTSAMEYAFDVLEKVSQGEFTKWSIVYDIRNMTVAYKTQNNRNARVFNFADLDFSCNTPSLYVDIDQSMIDSKLVFRPYSASKNRETMIKAFDAISAFEILRPFIPREEEIELLAQYPESTTCDR